MLPAMNSLEKEDTLCREAISINNYAASSDVGQSLRTVCLVFLWPINTYRNLKVQ